MAENPVQVVKAARSYKVPFFSCAAVSVVLAVVIVGGGVGGYVLYKNNVDAANQRVTAVTGERDALQTQLTGVQKQLAAATADDTTPSCPDQDVNIRFGTFTIPCGWHSYFEYQGAEVNSFGALSDGPILLLGQSDAPVGRANVNVTQYSDMFGNAATNPLEATITFLTGEGAAISTVTNDNGIEFARVSEYSEFRGETLVSYYAQSSDSSTVYVIVFSNNQSGDFVEPAMQSFDWTL